MTPNTRMTEIFKGIYCAALCTVVLHPVLPVSRLRRPEGGPGRNTDHDSRLVKTKRKNRAAREEISDIISLVLVRKIHHPYLSFHPNMADIFISMQLRVYIIFYVVICFVSLTFSPVCLLRISHLNLCLTIISAAMFH